MNPRVESVMKSLRRILLLALLALGIGAVFILLIHENPLEAYAALFKGAFVGKLKKMCIRDRDMSRDMTFGEGDVCIVNCV